MRNLTISALALISSTTALAQTGNTWSAPLSHAQDPADWPSSLEGIHACHIPPASGNQYGRIVLWGHGVDEQSVEGKSTQAYVWDTSITTGVRFIDQSGSPTLSPVAGMRLIGINLFCAGHTGIKMGTSSSREVKSTVSPATESPLRQDSCIPISPGPQSKIRWNMRAGIRR